jgi:hypothetical protein
MNANDIVGSIDIQELLDRLECCCDAQEYYKLNHFSSAQINELKTIIADSLITKLASMGLRIEHNN